MNFAAAPGASSVRHPGLWRSDPYLERYRIPGGGTVVVSLQPGDELTVRDAEGQQPAEVVAFGRDGKPDPTALTEAKTQPAEGLKKILGGTEKSASRVRSGLEKYRFDFADARAIRLFAPDSPAGEEACFVAARMITCAICAPGTRMAVDGQNPPTPLFAWVRRSHSQELTEPALPEPLADPRLDTRIVKRTASAFEVREGEFIQIIDVAGRECSDFLAFDLRRLDEGLERGLDTTATRTLMGTAYPGPGLYSKFFDQDMQPLIEVVRDTVGRHDTFGLSCTSKYYEDLGYFGHPNCSDNLSDAVARYGIARRRGWPAINFFYNTGIDSNNILYQDEPWSRPGDYVLMQALTDLVCATSACPDDITPANGWNPTDIHVRVYSREKSFSKAIGYRMAADSDLKLTEETGFHSRTSALTRDFTAYRGYWMPNTFSDKGVIDEYWACREKAVIMDLSPLRKFEVLGPDAEALVQYVMTCNARKLAIGQVVYTTMCYPHGGMLDDGTLFRLGTDNFRWIGGEDYGGNWMREQSKQQGYKAWVKSSTDQLHNVAVQGPLSREILGDVIWTSPAQPTLQELGWFRFTVGRIGGFDGTPVMVSRTGYTGELGYEVFCHPSDAAGVWDAIYKVGEPRGLTPLGLEALDMVRIEAGLVFSGCEFSDETDPFEAGIGFTVPLKTKEDDFVGRDALLRRKENPQRKLAGLELNSNESAAHGDCIHVGRAQIGVITSSVRSPILKKNIALCRMDINYAHAGTQVEVGKLDGYQKRIPAKIVPIPFYDPKKERVRA